jgi:hypothetical protein
MNEQDVVSFFTGKGYEPHQAAGIAGNLVQESSLNPTAKNPKSGAFGFAQWLGPRKKAFMDFAMKAKKDIKDPLAQLEFIDHELNTTERKAKDRLLTSRDASEAAVNFSNHYERAGANEKKNATRASYANKILGAFVPSAQAGETMDNVNSNDGTTVYKVRDPSGVLRKIRGPQGASDDEIITQAKLLFPETPKEKSMSWGETATRAASNIIPSTGKLISDVAGAVTSPVETMEGLIQLTSGGMAKILPDFIMQYAVPEKRKQAVDVANAVGGVYKQKYGTEEGFKRALAEDPATVAADLSILFSGGSSLAGKAGLGRTANALATGAKYTNPLTPIIAGATAAAPVVGKAAAIPVNYLRDVTNPKLAALSTAAEGRGQQIVNALRGQTEIVPGSIPTAGQAAADVGATRYAALQAEVAKQLPTEYLERANQQAAARVAQIQDVGKTEAELSAATKLRSQTTDPLYTAARAAGDVVDVNPILAKIDDVIAKNPGNKELLTEFNAIRGGLVDANGIPRTNAQEIASAIDGLKSALAKKENAFIKKQLTALKNDLTKAVPGYETAQQTFAELSKPINQMEVGQYLENKLTGSLSEGKLRPGVFAGAVKEAPTTLKRVTGESRFNTLDEVLTPDQMGKVQSVIDDLAREEKFTTQARAGAKGGEVLPATAIGTIPNWLNKVVTAANMIITRLQGKIDKATAIDLATEMLNPAKAAASMEKALARQAKSAATGAKVKAAAKTTADVAKSSKSLAVVNALAAQQQSQNQNALAQ